MARGAYIPICVRLLRVRPRPCHCASPPEPWQSNPSKAIRVPGPKPTKLGAFHWQPCENPQINGNIGPSWEPAARRISVIQGGPRLISSALCSTPTRSILSFPLGKYFARFLHLGRRCSAADVAVILLFGLVEVVMIHLAFAQRLSVSDVRLIYL